MRIDNDKCPERSEVRLENKNNEDGHDNRQDARQPTPTAALSTHPRRLFDVWCDQHKQLQTLIYAKKNWLIWLGALGQDTTLEHLQYTKKGWIIHIRATAYRRSVLRHQIPLIRIALSSYLGAIDRVVFK